MRLQLQGISDREFEVMHESVLRLLSEFGVLFEHDEARKLLSTRAILWMMRGECI